jgi:L-asparaginase/Glu-tRNA(Gln) amidotransferase subunit D
VIRYPDAAWQSRARRGDAALSPELNSNVCWIPYQPGCTPDFVAGALVRADGAVVAGTGLGHLPMDGGFLEAIRDSQKPVVLVSACWHAQVRLGLYDIDRAILATENLIPGHDLTTEAAPVKLMWVLGWEQALGRVRARMQEPIAGELTAA